MFGTGLSHRVGWPHSVLECLVPCSAFTPHCNILPIHTLEVADDGSSSWAPASDMGNLGGVAGPAPDMGERMELLDPCP